MEQAMTSIGKGLLALATFRNILPGALLAALIVLAAPSAALASGDFNIEQRDGLYTVSADQAPLSGLIRRLSELTDIPMNIAEGQDTQITLSLTDYTLESLIAELSSSSMIVRRNIDGTDVISEVVFMLGSEVNDAVAATLPSGEPNEGIIAGETVDESSAETPAQPAAGELDQSVSSATQGGETPAVNQ